MNATLSDLWTTFATFNPVNVDVFRTLTASSAASVNPATGISPTANNVIATDMLTLANLRRELAPVVGIIRLERLATDVLKDIMVTHGLGLTSRVGLVHVLGRWTVDTRSLLGVLSIG